MIRSQLVLAGLALLALHAAGSGPVTVVAAGSAYVDLVRLFREWREFQQPRFRDDVPDYTAAAMAAQRAALPEWQRRLAAIDTSAWPVSERVDAEIVRAEMNGLEFDHRVLRPWARNPCFYTVAFASGTDVPAREGPVLPGTLELWRYDPPLSGARQKELRAKLRAIPGILAQARVNLVEDAHDLWLLGARVKRAESAALSDLVTRLRAHHRDIVPDAVAAVAAVDSFGGWLETRARVMTAPSGIGIENYDWYLKNVHLSPYTWRDELALAERELGRALTHLKLEESRNAALPALLPAASAEEYHRRFDEGVSEYVRFLREKEILRVTDYMEPALRAHEGSWAPPESRDFFAQVEHRDAVVMRCHGTHWFDLARMEREPHPSPIRRVPLLYNIWDGRAEGWATAMEEMMMTAGLLDGRPRARELVYVLLANRAARAIAGLRQHSRELSVEQALRFAHETTPFGWLRPDGETVWAEQQLYLEQPGYGSSYLTGKAQLEKLMADRVRQLGDGFRLKAFFEELQGAGVIPLSLVRWELAGEDDEIRRLRQ
jgi:hypothetical protein